MKNGYWRVNVPGVGYRYEHRVVMERVLGRPLEPGEIVHHRDGNKQNNDPGNLEVMRKRAHDSIETASRHAAGWNPNLGKRKVSGEMLRTARKRIESGESIRSVSRSLGVSHNTLASSLRRPAGA